VRARHCASIGPRSVGDSAEGRPRRCGADVSGTFGLPLAPIIVAASFESKASEPVARFPDAAAGQHVGTGSGTM